MVTLDADKPLDIQNVSLEKEDKEVPSWASGENLRKIERDVTIPNMMRKRAKASCKEYLDSFSACIKGRTLSLAWSCKDEKEAMRQCLADELSKPELYEECRAVYLKERDEFQQHYAATGEKKRMKRKESSIF